MDSESRNKRMLRYGGVVLGIGVAGFVVKSYFSHITNRPIHRIRSLNKYEKSFRIPDSRAISLVKDFEEQLQQGLLAVNDSSLKMTPPWITALPTGFERGEFYSIDVGRSNLSIMYCHLGDLPNEILGEHSKAIGIPREHKTGSIQMLFNFIVTSFKIYMQMNGKQTGTEPLKIGFCCDFPLKIEATNVGFIEDLPQGFDYDDAIGIDVVKLLKETFTENQLEVDISVICNDAIGVLAAGRYKDPRTEIGVVLDTGTNAACMETIENIPKWVPGLDINTPTAVDIDWGNFSSVLLPRVQEDFILDRESPNPNHQLFEKMVCGDYLGELTRLLILSLINDGTIFTRGGVTNLETSYSMTLSSVCKIVSDELPPYESATVTIRQIFGPEPTQNEVIMIKRVCEIVLDRAALLIGCALSATIYHVRRDGVDPGHPVVIAIDGSSYFKFERFRDSILSETKRMLKVTYGCGHPTFEISPYGSGSCLGAAVLAAATVPKNSLEYKHCGQFVELPYLDH